MPQLDLTALTMPTPEWPKSSAGSSLSCTSFRTGYGFPETIAHFDAPCESHRATWCAFFYLKIRQGLHADTIQACSF